jgi:hypothetical protein
MSYSDPFKVKRVATRYIRKGMHLMMIRGRGLTLERCYDVVVGDGIYTIVLVLREEAGINKLLIASRVGSIAKNKPQPITPKPKKRIITKR